MDIIETVKDKVDDKDLQIELLEAITDKEEPKEEMISKAEYDKLKVDFDLLQKSYDDLQDKYISRFGNSSDTPNKVEPKEIKDEDEKEIIDVKDIFNNEEKED